MFFEFLEDDFVGDRLFAFAGVPTTTFTSTTLNALGTKFFALQNDFVLNSNIPFVSNAFGGSLIPGEAEGIADTAIVFDASGSTTAQRAWGHRTISINGQGSSQTSAASVAGGLALLDEGNRLFLEGGMSGSSRLSSTGAVNYFEGDVASVDDALSNDFFGDTAPDYFVLDGTEVNSVDGFVTRGIFLNTGDVDVTASTFFPNNAALVVSATPESTLGTRTTRQMFGYTAGVLQTYSSGSSTPASTTLFRNETGDPTSLNPALIDPSDVEVFTSAETNKVQADIEVSEFIESSGSSIFLSSSSAERFLADFGDDDAAFGDTTPTSGESVFVDDFAFGAGQFGGVSVAVSILEFSGSPAADAAAAAELYMVRVDTASEFSSGFLPSGVTVCDCDFLTWGFWGADIARSSSSSTELIHLANWVAGKVPAFADITTSGSAIYSGHAIGTVFNAGGVYQAIGDLAVTFNFANPAASTGTITNFDTANFNLAVTSFGTGISSTDLTSPNVFPVSAYGTN